MNMMEAIQARHSVRAYDDRPLPDDVREALQAKIDDLNEESGLHIQLVVDEPRAFSSMMAKYGKFSGVRNYIAMVGKKSAALDEKCGYYGEQLVLLAQQLGLNTCWVGLTFKKVKTAFRVAPGEKLCIVISLGYGKTQGTGHKSKSISELSNVPADSPESMPEWFVAGIETAALAPTAMNQQKFKFTLIGDRVYAESGSGFFSKVDFGIAKCHFEIGSGKDSSIWQ